MADETTVKVDSDSTTEETKKDVGADSSTADKDVKEKSSDSEVPWHKDPRFKSDLAALKTVKALMEANSLDDPDELKELVESGAKIKGKKVDLNNIDEIIARAEENKRHHEYWAREKEMQREVTESPEQTIARLKREKEEVTYKVTAREQAERAASEAKQSVDFYEGEVKNSLDLIDDLKQAEKEYIAWSLGVANECNEIAITDKKAIKKLLNSGVSKFKKLEESIKQEAVKEYLAGKLSVPNVPASSGAAPTIKTELPKGLKGLRSAFSEALHRKGE